MGITGRMQKTIAEAQKQKEPKKKRGKGLMEKGDGSLSPRLCCWNTALEMIKEKPVFGHGAGAKEDFKKRFLQKYPEYEKPYKHPHNQALDTLLSTGIFGLLLFVWFCVQTVCLVWKNRQAWAWIWLLGLGLFCALDVVFFLQISIFYLCFPLCFMMAETI